jgi:hypothetical protein
MHRSLVVLTLASVLLPACGGSDADVDADVETNAGTDVGADGAAETATSTEAADPVEIPGGFPDGVPLPAAVELEEFNEMVGDTTTIYDITGWNAGRPVPLGEAYLASLDDAGFEIVSRSDATDSVLFVATDDEWFVSAGFYPDRQRETGTSIGLTVGPAASAPGG